MVYVHAYNTIHEYVCRAPKSLGLSQKYRNESVHSTRGEVTTPRFVQISYTTGIHTDGVILCTWASRRIWSIRCWRSCMTVSTRGNSSDKSFSDDEYRNASSSLTSEESTMSAMVYSEASRCHEYELVVFFENIEIGAFF
jgi:hypothetical protein